MFFDGRKLQRYRTTIDFDDSRRLVVCAGSENTHFRAVAASLVTSIPATVPKATIAS
ncbi:hypothetical protein PAMC26510_29835 [Caballeronia sordidicola]|uniref:Uncharacterized protein n=1 Tax=Caballeronia sordidicola TaxID=196367 RepID=A0A242MBA7_CABSO|nr:hypothetical protein PAMC26510_29835 [Caballeronia sordidicola]OXC74827.1 hypothetical protein BSU04_30000 [Caballeronia sordidicola]